MERRSVAITPKVSEKGIEGYAALYSSLSRPIRVRGVGEFYEEIAPGTFAKILARNPDVIATVDHDFSKVLGRTSRGTLQLRDTTRGLFITVPELPDTTYASDLRECMRRGDIDQMSFSFSGEKDSWRESKVNGKSAAIRTLLDFDLHEVSVVVLPVYEATESHLRGDKARNIHKQLLEMLLRMGGSKKNSGVAALNALNATRRVDEGCRADASLAVVGRRRIPPTYWNHRLNQLVDRAEQLQL